MVCTDARERAAAGWFGFGRWTAPYWFIGPERCDEDEPAQYDAWADLGAGELVDLARHTDLRARSAASANRSWPPESTHGRTTARALIRTTLAFEDRDATDVAVADRYERFSWGRLAGEAAVIELCAISARSMSDPQRRRLAFVDDRIETIRARLRDNRPKLVVLYGADYVEYWTRIIGERIVLGMPRLIDGTVFAIARHPVAYGVSAEFWADLGRSARATAVRSPFGTIAISA